MKKKKWVISIIVLLCFIIVLFLSLQFYLNKKISLLSSEKVKIGSVSLSLCGLNINSLVFNYPLLKMEFPNLRIRPSWKMIFKRNNQIFAFSGPGQMSKESKSKGISLKGEISGNFKKGNIEIKETSLHIEDLGGVEISGSLKKWGKENFSADLKLKNISIRELSKFFEIELPVEGKAQGALDILVNEKRQIRQINFDLLFPEIYIKGGNLSLKGKIKGSYNLINKIAKISYGDFETEKGEKIIFKGTVGEERFTLQFNSEGLTVESIIESLPEKWRKKIEAKGNLKLKDFIISKDKKKF